MTTAAGQKIFKKNNNYPHLKSLNTKKKTMTQANGNPGSVLGQAQNVAELNQLKGS